jgi:hypothetical protein
MGETQPAVIEQPRGIALYHRIPPDIGGYVLALTLWSACLPLVDELDAVGVVAYCPVVRERRRSAARGTVETRTPAFGGYVWIENRTVHIPDRVAAKFRWFYRGDGYYWFSDGTIDSMRDLEASWPILRPGADDRARLAKGAEIEVIAGPFQGHAGLVQSDSGARVKVSLGGFLIDLPPFMVQPK